jgi:hypothetical protein
MRYITPTDLSDIEHPLTEGYLSTFIVRKMVYIVLLVWHKSP